MVLQFPVSNFPLPVTYVVGGKLSIQGCFSNTFTGFKFGPPVDNVFCPRPVCLALKLAYWAEIRPPPNPVFRCQTIKPFGCTSRQTIWPATTVWVQIIWRYLTELFGANLASYNRTFYHQTICSLTVFADVCKSIPA
jgi:hypothetical protein